jgi:hypothetical protein
MENNFALTGDDARILMASMLGSKSSVPIGQSLVLYFKLAEISNAQPPVEKQ